MGTVVVFHHVMKGLKTWGYQCHSLGFQTAQYPRVSLLIYLTEAGGSEVDIWGGGVRGVPKYIVSLSIIEEFHHDTQSHHDPSLCDHSLTT